MRRDFEPTDLHRITESAVAAYREAQGRDVAEEDDAALDCEPGGYERDGARDMLGLLLVVVGILLAVAGAALWPWTA
jgi:hypothetical protein